MQRGSSSYQASNPGRHNPSQGHENHYGNHFGAGNQAAQQNNFNRDQFITSLVNGGDKVITSRNRLILGQST